MTEAEWLACENPEQMIRHLDPVRDARRLILFHLSCCEHWSAFITHEASLQALHLMGQYVDRPASIAEWDDLLSLAQAASLSMVSREDASVAQVARESAIHAVMGMAIASHPSSDLEWARDYHWAAVGDLAQSVTLSKMNPEILYEAVRVPAPDIEVTSYQVRILREIFGNPFRPVALDPRWLTSTVRFLAQSIYEDRAFDRLPILADALMDDGCDEPDILHHCRGPGPHVRGCWVVDAILGKS